MVRRTKDEALATREALLDAAEQVFRACGVTRATLGDVASAAGVTRGAVYWHFRDKSELFAAMCSRATLPMQSRLQQAAESDGDDAIATLRAVSVQALREIASNPRTRAVLEIVLCKSERLSEATNGAPLADEMDRQCVRAVERIIARAVGQGRLPAATDNSLAAHMLHAFFHGVIQLWLTHPDAFDLDSSAPALVDTMLAGLLTAPPLASARTRDAA
ncbi:MAG TPA: TetR family transcriptional regulator [Accumulibacter sp.]|uniref:TetR family transcriptional regulator n=1 Tax=Accumulibacter sp. TaxID=2053492 RepID=UPI0025E5E82C|nr:TetR family transcriptional regulator [Accumulibacter sp.]MCM8600452.1 TetR family transcriptional regulator [Accumulibacter sp.]MCM8664234.1 TetR family transcriptional regulator [Accumulibacter sp.]HNC53448.1 TetR family transcriptional regulator [Accumulibacter sp.]